MAQQVADTGRSAGLPHRERWADTGAHRRRLRRLRGADVEEGLLDRLRQSAWYQSPLGRVLLPAVAAGTAALTVGLLGVALFPCGMRHRCDVRGTLDAIIQNPPILDASGRVLGYRDEKWSPPVSTDEVPCLAAQVYKEDGRLFERSIGVDPRGVARGVLGRPGTSTLEMQAARTVFPLSGTPWIRKLQEASIATRIRAWGGPDEIARLYSSIIYYGRDIHGMELAALSFFGKSAKDLSPGECGLLVTLPASPVRRDPANDLASADSARHYGLGLMLKAGLITRPVMEAELGRPITFFPPRPPTHADLLRWVRGEGDRCGVEGAIRSNIRPELQRALEVESRGLTLQDAVLDAIAIRPTGEVLAWVGQPGLRAPLRSLFKPLEAAVGEETGAVRLDTPVASLPWPDGGAALHRWLQNPLFARHLTGTVATALAPSSDGAAIKQHYALKQAGVLSRVETFGLPPVGYEPAHALGIVEAPLTKIAAAYATFANGGRLPRLSVIPGCSDGPPHPSPIGPRTAGLMFEALKGTLRPGGTASSAAARYWPGYAGQPVMAKTGTGDHEHGIVVATRDLILAVRLRSPRILRGTASATVAPIAMRAMRRAYE